MSRATADKKLAIDGGTPVRTTPFPAWPPVAGETAGVGIGAGQGSDRYFKRALERIAAVLSSGRINYHTGGQGKTFEAAFATWLGEDAPYDMAPLYALAVVNGTVALEIALRAHGIGSGDEVIIPSRTFIATAGAVVAVGATPVIADIDLSTNCVTAKTCAQVLTARTRAIIPVHLGGFPAPVAKIQALAAQNGAIVIEDCAQALGARSGGAHVGTTSAAGCFSFCQDKILPLGEGGMIVFTDEAAYHRAWAYRDHGRSYEKAHDATVGAASSEFTWLNDSFGTNARMTEFQSALGLAAFDELEGWLAQRAANAAVLVDAMAELPGIEPVVVNAKEDTYAYYRLYARLNLELLADGWTRNRVIDALNAEGVPVQYGSCALIGREEAFANAGIAVTAELPGAQAVHEATLAFFVHPTATEADMADVATALYKVLTASTLV
ncbi:MAG: DegT/DnrJ/EryC1/StrS family aminotransferase [Coriobacteriia bacterium]|nr:DegT/DnrJ/EryC1/StrS family aminotransferase [Coriobacteriia bacterium]